MSVHPSRVWFSLLRGSGLSKVLMQNRSPAHGPRCWLVLACKEEGSSDGHVMRASRACSKLNLQPGRNSCASKGLPNPGRGGAAGAVRGGMPASKSAPAFSENGSANGHVKAASPANGPNVAQTRGRGGLAFRGAFDPRGGPSRGGFAPRGGRGFAPGMDRGSPRGFGRGRGRGHFTTPSAS